MYNYYNDVEPYLRGQLSKEKSDAFENALKNDVNLEKEVDIRRGELAALEHLMQEDLRAKLQKWEIHRTNNSGESKAVIGFKKLVYFSMAAAASFLLIGGCFFFLKSSYSNSVLFKDNYISAVSTTKSVEENGFKQGLEAFANRDYISAIDFFSNISPDKNSYELAQSYIAHALILQDKFDEAISVFQKIIEGENQKLRQQGEWYQALIYLKLNKNDKAKELLTSIASKTSHRYAHKAKQLLKKVNSFWWNLVN